MIMIIAVLFAVAVHEVGHAMAIIATRAGEVKGMVISLKGIGVKWEPSAHDPVKRSIVSLSGSAINLALAYIFFTAGLEMFALTNLVFGAVNLLPLPGADGLRAFAHLREAA